MTKSFGHKPSNRAKKQQDQDDIMASLDLLQTGQAGYIEAEGLERSFHIQQDELVQHVSVQSAKKRFDLKLERNQGGYALDYTRSGRHLLIGSGGGHLAAFDWVGGRLRSEMQAGEKVKDVVWLQDETMFAAAQDRSVFIYDQAGTELHCLRKHTSPTHLEYLPYHFLLFSACGDSMVRYQDVSTGQLIAEWGTRAGLSTAVATNPSNGITITGHAGGVVNFWCPTNSNAMVKMFVHRGPVQAVAVDHSGLYMATSGLDGDLKTWDLRTFKQLDRYKLPGRSITSIGISQTGLLAAAAGPQLSVWKDVFRAHQKTPYLRHVVQGESIREVQFCPYEDVLGIGHTGGISSILVPGSGEANFDALEANPFASKRQRQEAQVKQLLDKLAPETIMLDPSTVGAVQQSDLDRLLDLQTKAADANGMSLPSKEKSAKRGPNSKKKRLLKTRANIIDEAKLQDAEAKRIQIVRTGTASQTGSKRKSVLDRFIPKDM